jgi:hypothetical protein
VFVPAAHGLHEAREGHFGRRPIRDHRAVAHDGDAIRDRQHLLELMADEDHGQALSGTSRHMGVQGGSLLGGERRGGLVEDQEAEARVERGAGYLEHLALGDVEAAHAGVRVDLHARKDLRQALSHHAAVGPEPRQGAAPLRLLEEEVLGRSEVGAERELLVDDPDARAVCGAGAVAVPGDLLAVD